MGSGRFFRIFLSPRTLAFATYDLNKNAAKVSGGRGCGVVVDFLSILRIFLSSRTFAFATYDLTKNAAKVSGGRGCGVVVDFLSILRIFLSPRTLAFATYDLNKNAAKVSGGRVKSQTPSQTATAASRQRMYSSASRHPIVKNIPAAYSESQNHRIPRKARYHRL